MDPEAVPWRATVDVELQDPLTEAKVADLITRLSVAHGGVSFSGKSDLRVKMTVLAATIPDAVLDVQVLLGDALAKVGCSLMVMRAVKVRADDKHPDA